MKNVALSLLVAALILFACYAIVIGTTPPCDAFRARLAVALKDDPAEVRKSAAASVDQMSSVMCASGAFRLAVGDRSFIRVVEVGK